MDRKSILKDGYDYEDFAENVVILTEEEAVELGIENKKTCCKNSGGCNKKTSCCGSTKGCCKTKSLELKK